MPSAETTLCIMSRVSRAARSRETALPWARTSVVCRPWSARRRARTMRGSIRIPSLARAASAETELDPRDGEALAESIAAWSTGCQPLQSRRITRGFVRNARPRARAETEAAGRTPCWASRPIACAIRTAPTLLDSRRTSAGTSGPKGRRSRIVFPRTRSEPSSLDRLEDLVRLDQPGVDGGRDEEGLHRRARFDGVGEGPRSRLAVVERPELVRVEAGRLGEGEHVAVARIHGQDEPAFGLRARDDFLEGGLRSALHGRVERQGHVAAGDLTEIRRVQREGAPPRVALHAQKGAGPSASR